MSRRTLFSNPPLNLFDQLLVELLPGPHEQKQHYTFIIIGRAALANANAVLDVVGEEGFEHVVDFCRAEADARGV